MSYAQRHHDARFFLQLMETLPAAEAAAGEIDKMQTGVMEMVAPPPRRCGRSTSST